MYVQLCTYQGKGGADQRIKQIKCIISHPWGKFRMQVYRKLVQANATPPEPHFVPKQRKPPTYSLPLPGRGQLAIRIIDGCITDATSQDQRIQNICCFFQLSSLYLNWILAMQITMRITMQDYKLLVSIDMLLYTGTETNTVCYIYCQLPTSHCST